MSAGTAGAAATVLVTGAAGLIGRKLTARLLADGGLVDPGSAELPVRRLVLADVVAPEVPADAGSVEIASVTADLAEPGVAERLVAERPAVVFHLAAVVSGGAEADFELGYRVNLDGTRALLEAIRAVPDWTPRVVFSSSIAVFGAAPPDRLPNPVPDDLAHTPMTSYGVQKSIGELLLADYTRRGFLDGVGIRLPTICIRPGAPNAAASGFFSSILREPLSGREAVLPTSTDVRHWFASPRSAVGFLLHAATLDGTRLGATRTLSMPGLSATVGEEIEALRRVAGDDAVALIRHQPDPEIARIVESWAPALDASRAEALGFVADASFDDIVRVHVEDELGGRIG